MKTYSGYITKLEPHQWLVFGSNTQGRHGKGAALTARLKFGAIYGQAEGPQGRSYAIVTKDLTKRVHPSVPKERIISQIVDGLYAYASFRDEEEFLVAYRSDATNLNGYEPWEMAQMFAAAKPPENIVFETGFSILVLAALRFP
mgnify:CR=1 FL=1